MTGTLGHPRSDCSYHLWITSVWTTRPGRDEAYVRRTLSANQSDLNNKTAGECQRTSPRARAFRPDWRAPASLPQRINGTGTNEFSAHVDANKGAVVA